MSSNFPQITFSTCWYNLKSKFPESIYREWMDNMLTQVHHFYLVIYTDKPEMFHTYAIANPTRIKIVTRAFAELYNYRYRYAFWKENHNYNHYLKDRIGWELNLLWSEKVHFVADTRTQLYFEETPFYGWIDIGTFRCRPQVDLPKTALIDFPNPQKIAKLNPTKIHYSLVNNNPHYTNDIYQIVQNAWSKNEIPRIPQNQITVGGSPFIVHKDRVEWWKNLYNDRVERYMKERCVIKDDQIILADLIFSHMDDFQLYTENLPPFDNWFMFTRIFA